MNTMKGNMTAFLALLIALSIARWVEDASSMEASFNDNVLVGSSLFSMNHSFGQRAKSTDRFNLVDIISLGKNELWAIGNEDNITTSNDDTLKITSTGFLLVSRDGGQSWKKHFSLSNSTFNHIYNPFSGTMWILGYENLVLKSTDGGSSWNQVYISANFYPLDIQFIDPSRGWILDLTGKIIQTKDGGDTWNAYDIGSRRYVSNFSFNNDLSGWVVCEYGRLYQSTNSGMDWQDHTATFKMISNLPNEKDLVFRAVTAISEREIFLFAEVRSKGTMMAEEIKVFHSIDGAKTWNINNIPTSEGVYSVNFLSEKESWLVPRRRVVESLFHTLDGWKTWEEIKVTNGNPRKLLFFNSNIGWFIAHTDNFSSNTIFSTQDTGRTWNKIRVQTK